MARKRKADHDSAIAGALSLFWKNGFHGTSTRELEEQTGLTRFTLQKTYGGKENFFLETLDAYLDNAESKHFPNAETYTLDDLADWFEQIASPERMPAVDDVGCLAFNSISQFDRINAEVNARIERYLGSLEERFVQILCRAEETGDATFPHGPEQAAKVLTGLLLGLHTLMKARDSDEFARTYASAFTDLIVGWKREP